MLKVRLVFNMKSLVTVDDSELYNIVFRDIEFIHPDIAHWNQSISNPFESSFAI
jgi:hypothetical protein